MYNISLTDLLVVVLCFGAFMQHFICHSHEVQNSGIQEIEKSLSIWRQLYSHFFNMSHLMKNSKEWLAKFLTSFYNALCLQQNGAACNAKLLFRNMCGEKCS